MPEHKVSQGTSREELGGKLRELIVEKQQAERRLAQLKNQVKKLKGRSEA